jgi:cytochrome c biogenesis protein
MGNLGTSIMKNKWLHRMGSLKLGVILLMLVALAVIVGTVVVQKPLAEPGQIENLYSPTQAKIYGALGLFDVFHAWWFTALLALMMVNLTTASAERFPVARGAPASRSGRETDAGHAESHPGGRAAG